MKKGFALDSIYLVFVTILAVMFLVVINKVSDEMYDGLSDAIPGEITDFGTVDEIKDRTNSGYSNYLLMLPLGLLGAFGLTIKFASSVGSFDSIEAFIHFLLAPFVALTMFVIVSVGSTFISVPTFSTIVSRNNVALPVLTGMPMVSIGVFMFFMTMIVMFARGRDDI